MKAILIIDDSLLPGVAANAAAILALTLGCRVPELLGDDVRDASGEVHAGITRLPIPVIGASAATIRLIRRSLRSPEYRDEIVVGFTRTAQACRSYEEYAAKMA